MREYAKVAPQFWTGITGKALKKQGVEAVIVALYLMTSPHANMIGVYHCPIGYIVIDTGLDFEGASKGLASAIEVGFCTYDEVSDYVFVHEFAAYQIGEELSPHDNQCKGVRNELAKLPKNQCRRGFVEKYRTAFHIPAEVDPQPPTVAPPKALTSQEQEQEQKQEQDQGQDQKQDVPPDLPAVPVVPAADAPANPRGSRLMADWQLPKPWGEWALTEYPLWTADKVRREAASFRDHWTAKSGKDATKLDWLATWRNWCRSSMAHRDDPKPGRPHADPASEAQRRAASDAEAMRLLGITSHGDTIDA